MAFIGNTNTTQGFIPAIDYFNGNGSTTAFTLSRPVASVAQVQAVVNNVAQNPSDAFTVSSNTITFTSAPSSGTNNIYVYYTSPITQIIAPGQGTVTTTSLAGGTVTTTADATLNGLTVGKGAGSQSSNTAVGASALSANTTGNTSTAVGSGALQNNTTGAGNTAVGQAALQTITTANYNDAFGWVALNANTSGNSNAAFGNRALSANTTGSNNTGIGVVALGANTTGSNNTAIGLQALTANTASNNTAIGYNALSGNSSGAQNIGLGYTAGNTITTGTYNVCIGYSAGSFGASLTTGGSNIYIGTNSGASAGGVTQEMLIGTQNVQGKGSSTGYIYAGGGGVYQGNNSSSWSTTSDRRLKKNIVDNTDGLDKITAVRIRNFEYRLPEEVTELDEHCAVPNTGVQLGVIAQELQTVLPDCVKTESTGVLSVDPDNLTWYMVNAIKELKTIVDTQAATINALTARIVALENK